MPIRIVSALALGFMFVAACVSDGAGPGGTTFADPFTCTYPSGNSNAPTCGEYKNMIESTADITKQNCMQVGGTIGSTCPTANLLGCCAQANGADQTATLTICYYSPSDQTAEELMSSCPSPGVWSTTP